MFGKSKNDHDFFKISCIQNVNEIEKIFVTSKSSRIVKYPKNSKTIRDLQNSLLIHKNFADSKKSCISKNFVK